MTMDVTGIHLEPEDFYFLVGKAEAAMPFLKDVNTVFQIQRLTKRVFLKSVGSSHLFYAALLSLPVEGDERLIISYMTSHLSKLH